jgi:hypothetical protein
VKPESRVRLLSMELVHSQRNCEMVTSARELILKLRETEVIKG